MLNILTAVILALACAAAGGVFGWLVYRHGRASAELKDGLDVLTGELASLRISARGVKGLNEALGETLKGVSDGIDSLADELYEQKLLIAALAEPSDGGPAEGKPVSPQKKFDEGLANILNYSVHYAPKARAGQ